MCQQVLRRRLADNAKSGDNGDVTSWYRSPPVYFGLVPLLLGACSAKNSDKTKLRCAVSRVDAEGHAAVASPLARSAARPPGWLRRAPAKASDSRDGHRERPRGEVLYLDAQGNLVKASSKDQVPEEFRNAMVARSGGLGAPGSFSVIDFAKLPDPARKAALAAQPSSGKRSASGENPAVKVFGTTWCKACQMTKAYLTGKDVPFAMRDIEGDSAALAEYMSYGGNEVPLVVIGDTVIRGFVPGEIDRALGP
jgi:glutaredoxin